MSRAFLMTLERLAFMTVLVISRMIDSIRLEMTDSRMGSKVSTVGPAAARRRARNGFGCRMRGSGLSAIHRFPDLPNPRKPARNSFLIAAGNCDHATCDAMVHANHCQHA